MTKLTTTVAGRQRRYGLRFIIGIGAFALICGSVIAVFGGVGPSQSHAVRDLLSQEITINPIDATSELCADVGCVEGWRTEIGSYLRFDSEGNAEHWLQVLGDDGRQWKNMVLDMRGFDINFDQQRKAVDILFSTRDWS
jgi:hypothetical protein